MGEIGMATKVANLWWLRHLTGLLQGDERPEDPENEDELLLFLGRRLSPLFAVLSSRTKVRIEDALRYYLNRDRAALLLVLQDAYELPFVPSDPQHFFSLVWKCLFRDKVSDLRADEEWSAVDEQRTARLLFDAESNLTEWQKQFIDHE
jgi:hypothetical protein